MLVSLTNPALLSFCTLGAFILVTSPASSSMVFRTRVNIVIMTYTSYSNAITILQLENGI